MKLMSWVGVHRFAISVLVALGVAVPAAASAQEGDLTVCWVPEKTCPPAPECPPAPACEKPKPKKKWKKRRPCECKGQEGPRGPQGPAGPPGPKGDDGEVVIVEKTVHVEHIHTYVDRSPALSLGLGYMGSVYWPSKSYAWEEGPSLRVTSGLRSDRTVNLELGWAPGLAGGAMMRATLTDWDWLVDEEWIGFGGGVFAQIIGTDPRRDLGYFVGFLPEVSVRHHFERITVSANVGPSLAYAYFEDDKETKDFVLGFVGSAGVSINF